MEGGENSGRYQPWKLPMDSSTGMMSPDTPDTIVSSSANAGHPTRRSSLRAPFYRKPRQPQEFVLIPRLEDEPAGSRNPKAGVA